MHVDDVEIGKVSGKPRQQSQRYLIRLDGSGQINDLRCSNFVIAESKTIGLAAAFGREDRSFHVGQARRVSQSQQRNGRAAILWRQRWDNVKDPKPGTRTIRRGVIHRLASERLEQWAARQLPLLRAGASS